MSHLTCRFTVVVVDFSEWQGTIDGRVDPTDATVIEVPIKASAQGGSGTFLAADHDGTQWWVKPLNNNQGPRVTVTEALVAMAGELVGAPVCESRIVYLPPDLEGWQFRPGSEIESGYAHASRGVVDAVEHRTLQYRDRDDNARRHVGLFALYDWCWGGDDQWLYSEAADRETFSHDHGWYLPETGPDWTAATLQARVDEVHVPPWPTDGLDPEAITAMCSRLRELPQDALRDRLLQIPASWPVDDQELEYVGWFLESRASEVADRLEALGGGS